MAVKIKIPRRRSKAPARSSGRSLAGGRFRSGLWFYLNEPLIRIAVAVFLIASTAMLGAFAYFYIRYEKVVDRRMRGQIFNNASKIYALPHSVRIGQKIKPQEIALQLARAGYSEQGPKVSRIGSYRVLDRGIEIKPGPQSYHNEDGALVRISQGKVERIIGMGSAEGKDLSEYELEPQLVTALFEAEQRSKRELIKYDDIPKVMVDAVLAIEDRRFFQHSGVNYFRVAQAVWRDLLQGRRGQGGSTLTMQISRGFFLTPEKTVKRKLTEMLIAFELEQKFSKKQIFELYANQVYMGQRGSFTINGFGEASRAYFNKNIKEITLPEAALLAAIIQRPSYLNPYKSPERALDRRNLVLDSMVETGALKRDEADRAKATPLKLAPPNVEASDAPYFVDLVKEALISRYSERELNEQAYRIFTSLDPDLQRAAADTVEEGMKAVDAQITKLRTRKVRVGKGRAAKFETKVLPGPQAQVALIVMDPHTGDVLALVGGRNYGASQFNHAVARRPTGSIFKPFVYAAAINTGISGSPNVLTPASMIDDSPSTFAYGDQIYEPRNYKEEYHGMVTARYALAMSLNNATVKLAEQVGYDNVAAMAKAAGISSVQPTPAMALGAYDATPLEMAGAYTVFSNNGVRLSPRLIQSVHNAQGEVVEVLEPEKKPVLDPRVASVMTSMMEAVMNSGLAVGVRARGFIAPAAGKTGTSHDAWFAGYTSNLLCIVWIGYDDYSDLKLSGATVAAPIWADFMKRAIALPQYREVKPFAQPAGVVDVRLDKLTNRLATPACPETYAAAFIAGTEPHETCDQQEHRGILSKILDVFGKPAPAPPPSPAGARPGTPPPAPTQTGQNQDDSNKKKGLFGKIFGALKGDSDKKTDQPPPANPPPDPNKPR